MSHETEKHTLSRRALLGISVSAGIERMVGQEDTRPEGIFVGKFTASRGAKFYFNPTLKKEGNTTRGWNQMELLNEFELRPIDLSTTERIQIENPKVIEQPLEKRRAPGIFVRVFGREKGSQLNRYIYLYDPSPFVHLEFGKFTEKSLITRTQAGEILIPGLDRTLTDAEIGRVTPVRPTPGYKLIDNDTML